MRKTTASTQQHPHTVQTAKRAHASHSLRLRLHASASPPRKHLFSAAHSAGVHPASSGPPREMAESAATPLSYKVIGHLSKLLARNQKATTSETKEVGLRRESDWPRAIVQRWRVGSREPPLARPASPVLSPCHKTRFPSATTLPRAGAQLEKDLSLLNQPDADSLVDAGALELLLRYSTTDQHFDVVTRCLIALSAYDSARQGLYEMKEVRRRCQSRGEAPEAGMQSTFEEADGEGRRVGSPAELQQQQQGEEAAQLCTHVTGGWGCAGAPRPTQQCTRCRRASRGQHGPGSTPAHLLGSAPQSGVPWLAEFMFLQIKNAKGEKQIEKATVLAKILVLYCIDADTQHLSWMPVSGCCSVAFGARSTRSLAGTLARAALRPPACAEALRTALDDTGARPDQERADGGLHAAQRGAAEHLGVHGQLAGARVCRAAHHHRHPAAPAQSRQGAAPAHLPG